MTMLLFMALLALASAGIHASTLELCDCTTVRARGILNLGSQVVCWFENENNIKVGDKPVVFAAATNRPTSGERAQVPSLEVN